MTFWDPQIIGTIGLGLNIVGVILVFFFAYPQPTHEGGFGMALEDGTELSDGRTVAEHRAEQNQQKERYFFWSRAGLLLMAVGFIFQLIALWLVSL